MKPCQIQYEITPLDEIVDTLLDFIKGHFKEDYGFLLNPEIESELAEYFTVFDEELFCLVEYPYVDKVYRNSYYTYFSSKHSSYRKDCIRVSFFSKEISVDDFLNISKHSSLQDSFFGTLVVRPTLNAMFGRNLINPKALQKNNFKICMQISEVSVYGVKLKSIGFPHSMQDTESIKCAETTIWALMEYFSSRYIEYKPVLPSDIHKTLERITFERQLPSRGLTMDEISFALRQFGFGTKIYSQGQYKESFKSIIDCYIESGIPILLGLEAISGEGEGHVVICIGKEDNIDLRLTKMELYTSFGKEKEFYDACVNNSRYVVQDDNLQPYQIIDLDHPGENYQGDEKDNYKIDAIIVPLYPKIYLEAVLAKETFLQILGDNRTGNDFESPMVLRRFLASSRSFKAHISGLKMEQKLKANLLTLKMPKFIWVAELYENKVYNSVIATIDGLIILDATEANNIPFDSLIFAGYPDVCYIRNENNFVNLPIKFQDYLTYSNLK